MIYPLPNVIGYLGVNTELFGHDGFSQSQVLDTLLQLKDKLACCAWDVQSINAAIRVITTGTPRQVFGVLRVAITSKVVSLPMCESLEILGRRVTLQRICKVIEMVGKDKG